MLKSNHGSAAPARALDGSTLSRSGPVPTLSVEAHPAGRLMKKVLVTGATGNIGRQVVSQLPGTGCRIRAFSRSPQSANLPHHVEVVRGDLSVPETLDVCLQGVDAVFLVWVAPMAAAAAALERIASRVERIVFLSSPHRTAHPFFQQPNALVSVHVGIEHLVETSGLRWTFLRPAKESGSRPP